MMKHLEETLIDSKQIARGKWIKITHDTVNLPDGTTAFREYIKHSGAVAIIAITKDKQIVLEYQYRHPVNKVMLEIPAGKLEPDEDPLNAAKRELQEETGYNSGSWLELGSCFPCIGYSNEQITYYLAENLIAGIPNLDEGEFLETTLMDIDKCFDLAYSGKITDGKTLAGLMLYQGYLSGKLKY
ncbi:MAG: hydrolase [Burkholderiales bacterium]|jgi:ADP-ribose pyrophosphatase|nr:hydrolase [Burkholderiales bacterium]